MLFDLLEAACGGIDEKGAMPQWSIRPFRGMLVLQSLRACEPCEGEGGMEAWEEKAAKHGPGALAVVHVVLHILFCAKEASKPTGKEAVE